VLIEQRMRGLGFSCVRRDSITAVDGYSRTMASLFVPLPGSVRPRCASLLMHRMRGDAHRVADSTLSVLRRTATTRLAISETTATGTLFPTCL
jgi:hypothetical protein